MSRQVHDLKCPWVTGRAACTCGVGIDGRTANTLADYVLKLEAQLKVERREVESLRRALDAERLLRAAVEESRDRFHRALQDLMDVREESLSGKDA